MQLMEQQKFREIKEREKENLLRHIASTIGISITEARATADTERNTTQFQSPQQNTPPFQSPPQTPPQSPQHTATISSARGWSTVAGYWVWDSAWDIVWDKNRTS